MERQEKRERQRLFEARMQQQDRLNVLGELTAGIAHELNTPLGNVLGYAELLMAGEVDKERRDDLQRIIDSALTGREVVKRLMYFSCEMPSQFRMQDLNGVVAGVLRLLHRQVEKARLVLRTDLSRRFQSPHRWRAGRTSDHQPGAERRGGHRTRRRTTREH